MTDSTHERILDAATKCFGKHGYKGTSIDKVAEKAQVAKGTVYLYCENKEDLFYQAVHRELRQWVGSLSMKIDRRKRADHILFEMAAADLEFVEERPLVRDLLHGMFHGLLPGWSERWEELREIGLKHVVEVLELGVQQGVFASDLDVAATARVLQEMQVAGTLLAHRTSRPIEEVRRQQIASVNLVMKGLLAR